MCTTCGCESGKVTLEGGDSHHHPHEHQHNHHHSNKTSATTVVHHHYYYGPVEIHYHYDGEAKGHRSTAHPHRHSTQVEDHADQTEPHTHEVERAPEESQPELKAEHAHAPEMAKSRMVQVEQDILAKNNAIAEQMRAYLVARNIKTFNLISSPGAGKTTLLTNTLKHLDPNQCAVIEGDQQTSNDADRIRATGAKAIQINTGKGCHLDAHMVAEAIARLMPEDDSLLFIENVGNLICPAAFDLGESYKIAILSVTEGEDKPLKYPDIFAQADLLLITKVDLLPYINFDLDSCIRNAKRINPEIKPILISSLSGAGMQEWLDWLGSC